jgi:hypothetical protein
MPQQWRLRRMRALRPTAGGQSADRLTMDGPGLSAPKAVAAATQLVEHTTDIVAGTLIYTDPATHITTKIELSNSVSGAGNETSGSDETITTAADGTTGGTPTQSDAGDDTDTWTFHESTTLTNADGSADGPPEVIDNSGSSEIAFNGGGSTPSGSAAGFYSAQASGVSEPVANASSAEMTLAEKGALWRGQAEIAKLQQQILTIERSVSKDAPEQAKRNVARAVEELRDQLYQKIIDVNKTVPIGNIANGDAPVARMTLVQKLGAAIQQAITSGQLAEDVVAKLVEMAKPENLATAAAFIGGYALAHASPLAPGLAIVDTYILGTSGTEAGLAMWQLYLDLDSATTDAELTKASVAISELASGPLADLLVKGVMLGAGKALGSGVRKFHENYEIEVPRGLADGSQPLSLGALPVKIKKRSGLPKRGSKRWEQLQSLKTRLRNLSPQNNGNSGIRGTNRPLAKVTAEEADFLGKAFVGDGFTTNSAGMYISKDGTRLYRPPTRKPGSPYSETGTQANFILRERDEIGRWQHARNGHIDIAVIQNDLP